MSEQTIPLLIDLREAALLLGMSVRTLRRLINAGDVPTVRIGTKIRIRRQDIDDLIARHLQPRNVGAS